MRISRTGVWAALLVVSALATGPRLFAQSTDAPDAEKRTKNLRVTPFVAPGFTPELGGLLAGGGLFTFSTNPENEKLPRSNINAALSYSSSGSVVLSCLGNTYWADDKLRVLADLWFKDMPDNYWGVGYDAARSTSKGADTTEYDRRWWQINPRFLWQFKKDLFAGFGLDFNRTKASDLSAGVAADPTIQQQGTDNFNGGAGFIFMHDSRDMPVNAYSGWLLGFSATFYGNYLGSDNAYQTFELDYRQYRQIARPGSTLAWKIYSRVGMRDVPWPEATQVGNPFNLRGYYWGHYRDVAGTYGLLEYRYKIMTNKENRLRPYEGRKESRHGFVAWVGLGAIGPAYGDQLGNWMPNAGFGYRFEVQPRNNARLDVGFGHESFGVYFNFNEAF